MSTKFFFCCVSLLFGLTASYAADVLKLSTTTSTENSGLLQVLHPVFEQQYGVRIETIAVGTGKALRLGANGDVDVVFVHAPNAEKSYVEQGDFIDRRAVMHNDFIVIGPASDPANVIPKTSVIDVFKTIAAQTEEFLFVSRGDDSGTHKKERAIWALAQLEPKGNWYAAAGQGMGAVLNIANEKLAYTLSDRGTYLAYQDKIELEPVFEGDPVLHNPYHVMAVNPHKHPHVNYSLAKQYIEFLCSEPGQRLIADYKISGQALFYPDAMSQPR